MIFYLDKAYYLITTRFFWPLTFHAAVTKPCDIQGFLWALLSVVNFILGYWCEYIGQNNFER